MAKIGQPTEGQTIDQAPAWVREVMTPTGQLTAMHEQVRRYLAGDRSVPVEPLDDVDALFRSAGGRGAA